MKKLITLFLALAGMVGTASATDYVVYLNPGWTDTDWAKDGARFALYMFNESSNANEWVSFQKMSYTQSGSNKTRNVWGAIFSAGENNYDKMIICRMNPSNTTNSWGGVWHQTGNLSAPTSDVYYDLTGWGAVPSDLSEGNLNGYAKSTSFSFVVAADKEIVNDDQDWKADTGHNDMVSNHDFTYSYEVTNKLIVPDSYGYKLVFSPTTWWCGDSGENFPLSISEEGYYDIVYSFNFLTGAATAVATRDDGVTITYNLAQYDGSGYTGWESNNMLVYGELASYTVTNQDLTTETNSIKYKIVRREWENGLLKGEAVWKQADDTSVDANYNFGYTPANSGTYTVSYYWNIRTSTTSVETYEPATAYYYIGGSNGWSLGDAMTETGPGTGIYFITLNSDQLNQTFAIAPVYALSGDAQNGYGTPDNDSSWALLLHPRNPISISNFKVYQGSCQQSNTETNWAMAYSAANGTVKFQYNSNDNTWSATTSYTETIGPAGYMTYSNDEKCTISGASAIYVADVNHSATVHMEEKDADTVWPAREGVVLKGSNGQNVTITAIAGDVTASTIGTNYLVGSGNSTASITAGTGIYIFNWDGTNTSSVGFYLANSGTLGAHKAYLDVSSAPELAREFLAFDFGNEETGINAMSVNRENAAYSLSGQRVAQPTKGLYIINGKKVVVK